MKKFYYVCMLSLIAVGLTACGSTTTSSGGGSSSSTETVTVSSLASVPDIADMISGTSTSSSSLQSALLAAVSGTPTNLVDITDSAADTLFWNGLIADIGTNGAEASDATGFWDGEGACRMAQDVGYSFQNIEQAGTSMCYIKLAPTATSGTTITSGDVTDATQLFVPTAATRVVKVQVSGDEEGEQDIFIRVYGTDTTEGAAGFGLDLWFCASGGETSAGYEQIRVNSESGVMTQTSVDTQRGSFISQFTGSLTEDADGNPSFDSSEAQSALFTYVDPTWGTFKGSVSVTGTSMSSKGWNQSTGGETDFERKTYTTSTFSGSTLATLKFLSAGFATQWSVDGTAEDATYGAVEFQDTRYVSNTDSDHFTTVNNFDFSTDSFWSGTLEADASLLAAISDYSCSETADSVVTMDMSDTTFQTEVVAQCEVSFSDMNFCDSDSINSARNAIFSVN